MNHQFLDGILAIAAQIPVKEFPRRVQVCHRFCALFNVLPIFGACELQHVLNLLLNRIQMPVELIQFFLGWRPQVAFSGELAQERDLLLVIPGLPLNPTDQALAQHRATQVFERGVALRIGPQITDQIGAQ